MGVMLLGSSSMSSWGSCLKISANLKKSYSLASKKSKTFFEQKLFDPLEFSKPTSFSIDLFDEMIEKKIHKVVFVDHSPHPKNFIFALREQRADLYSHLEFVFHVYGDFTLHAKDWYELFLDSSLKATFICSSDKQKKMVESFLFDSDSKAQVSVIPFPVCAEDHFFDPVIRRDMRDRLGIEEESFVVLYSGRLSLQKNILFIIEEFKKFFSASESSTPPTLVLAGDVDDLVSPMCGGRLPLGAHFYLLRKAWLDCPDEIRKKIIFLGNVPENEINGVYCASDLLFSPSLYHDEDYGMSVAESLMTGLPCLITDWGGYSSFHQLKMRTDLIPVKLSYEGFDLCSVATQNSLIAFSQSAPTDSDRLSDSQIALKKISVSAASDLVHQLILKESGGLAKPYVSFSPHLKDLAMALAQGGLGYSPQRNGIYYKTYSSYLEALHD